MRKQSTKFASWNISTLHSLSVLLGSLCSNEDDDYENDTSKVTSRSSKFIVIIPTCSIRQMLAFFFLELNSKRLYRSSEKEKESHCLEFTSSITRRISRRCRAVTAKQCTKKRDLVFFLANLSLFLFWSSRWRRRRRYLRSLSTLPVFPKNENNRFSIFTCSTNDFGTSKRWAIIW